MDLGKRLSSITIGLHWVVAIGILFLIGVGIYMVKTESWHLYDLHKSIGLLIFAVIIVRVAWRIKNGLPPPVRQYSAVEHLAAKQVHYLLLICSVVMPVTGMVYSAAGGHGFGVFSWSIFPSNYSPDQAGQAIPLNAQAASWGQSMHSYVGYFLLALLIVHITGALKHHVLDRDRTLTRMLGIKARE